MSRKKSADRRSADRRATNPAPPLASPDPPTTIVPMTPRRQLLVIFGLMLLLWIGMMIVIYCAVVYPHRYPHLSPTSTSAP